MSVGLAAARERLRTFFLFVVLVMAAHESEHVAEVVQKHVLANPCPTDCRGLLGFALDVEWVHAAYNHSLLVLLVAVYVGYRMWERRWRERDFPGWALMTAGVFVIQAYHVFEHSLKLDQWFANGHHSPTPGLLGQFLPLVELHFAINTVVFACVLAAYFRFSFAPNARVVAAGLAALLVLPLAAAWATRTPTTYLAAGVHEGPLLLNRTQKLVGAPGAVVRGGIRISADGVSVRGLTVVGGEYGIAVDGATGVRLEDVTVSGASLDGINVRRSSVTVRDCAIVSPGSAYVQGIDISFAFDLPPSHVERCRVIGGREGIVSHFAHVRFRGNHVERTTLRAITVTEMSMGAVEGNSVEGAVGVAIYCGDYSRCAIERNTVLGTRRDRDSDDGTRMGYAIQAHFGASATVAGNLLARNENALGEFAQGEIVEE